MVGDRREGGGPKRHRMPGCLDASLHCLASTPCPPPLYALEEKEEETKEEQKGGSIVALADCHGSMDALLRRLPMSAASPPQAAWLGGVLPVGR